MASVTLKNVSKKFGRTIAVNRINLRVNDGEFMVLLGPSGCGKTTTLRLIAGLEYPDEGEIYIGDRLVNDVPPKDRDVSMVFQSYALYPHMKVYDNIAFPLKLRKFSKREIDKKVMEVAKLLQISELLDRKPSQLSGGQQQRVALARAIVREPKVFLMDEPLSNLDAKLRVYMRAELKKLQKELKITTIYVTHDQVEAMTMADRIAVMNNGEIQQVGTPSEIYAKPVNLFVASFIGSPPMNFIDGVLSVRDDEAVVEIEDISIKLPKPHAGFFKGFPAETEVVLGIRPENIVVSRVPLKGQINIRTEVYVVEPMGSETIVNFIIGGRIFKAKTTNVNFTSGDKIYVSFTPDKLYLFKKKTGKNIFSI
ncbi:MAG: sugar ABC transporter ATP-binding protein [Thermoprotei archaeon]|nr:MAG: sugar ABC transporter ATP-binding protein [Thermoprotei archaeon]